MSYPNYRNDRKSLGRLVIKDKNCFKDLRSSYKKFWYTGYFVYTVGTTVLTTVGPAYSVFLPVPIQIVRLQENRNRLHSVLSEIKVKYGIAPANIPSRDKIILTESQLNKVELILNQYRLELVTLDDVVLELRGGQDSSSWVMFIAFLYLLQYYTESAAFTVPPFFDPFNHIGRTTPKLTGASDSCSRRYPFERVYMKGKKQTISSEVDEYLSMNDRHLKPHEIDKTVFESDMKLTRSYNGFILSNSKIKKKFKGLEDKLSQGHFNSGREKGFKRWVKSKTICYIGSKGDAARIYYRFVPGEHKIEILAYSNN